MLILKNGYLVTGERQFKGDLAIEGTKIAEIGANLQPSANDTALDVSGLLVFPGFIDAHTHLDMNNGVVDTADDFDSGTSAALIGGTTSIIDFATQTRGGTLRNAFDTWYNKAYGHAHCHVAFHMALTDWNQSVCDQLPEMFRLGIPSFKLYLAYESLRLPDRAVYEILLEMKKLGGLLGVHCENGDLVNALVDREKSLGHWGPDAHPASRPPLVEAEAISRLLYIAALADCPAHIVHLSSEAGLKEVRKARTRGQTVYVETCPQYLLLNDEVYHTPGFDGAKYVCSPPIRSEADRKALVGALLTGEIDTVATDHCSFTLAQKALGQADFSKIPNGLPGIEHRPLLLYGGFCENGAMSLSMLCRLLSENVAKCFGLFPRKGALRVGSDADLTILEPGTPSLISAQTQHMKADYTPFEGMKVNACVRYVFLGGQLAAEQGALKQAGRGQYLMRSPVA